MIATQRDKRTPKDVCGEAIRMTEIWQNLNSVSMNLLQIAFIRGIYSSFDKGI